MLALGAPGCRPTPPAGSPVAVAPFDPAQPRLAALLREVVREGLVDYPALRKRRGELQAELDAAGAVRRADFQAWPAGQQLAFLLNLYNAHILALLSDNPGAASIKELGGLRPVWKQPRVRLFGETISLDDLEHGVIRKQFKNPAVHFALVCGAKGCPPLRAEPYAAADLERQFREQARAFLGDGLKNRVDLARRVVRLSPIFKWYREDFAKSDAEMLEFIAQHLPPAEAAAVRAGGFTVEYLDYDWSVNAAPMK